MSEEHTKRGNTEPDVTDDGDVYIDDIPPRRTRDFADLMHAAGALVVAALMLLAAVYLRGLTAGVESDVHNAGQAIGWVMDLSLIHI